MGSIPDRSYNTACGRLASLLGISLAAARRRVDMRASQQGIRDAEGKLALADRMLAEERTTGFDTPALLTAQLGAEREDENFMVED